VPNPRRTGTAFLRPGERALIRLLRLLTRMDRTVPEPAGGPGVREMSPERLCFP